MKDTEVEPVVALTGIAVEVGEGWKFVTLASPQRASCWLRRYYPRPAQGRKTNSAEIVSTTHTMSDKQRYLQLLEQIRKLEIERAELISRGQPVPRRLNFNLEMLRADAEELRLWGHREFVRTVRALRGLARSEG